MKSTKNMAHSCAGLMLLMAMCKAGPAELSPPLLRAAAPVSKAEVARYAEQILADNYAKDGPGAAVIVARGDEVLFRGARGVGDVEHATPLMAADMFGIASITKQFVAAGLLKLVEAGKVSLDDPLSKFIKDYPDGDRITVLELLNHTSGIKNYTDDGDMDAATGNKMTTLQLVDTFKKAKPEFAPGASWAYNNSGYVLVGAVIEVASGMPWYAYLQQTLFQPLGLTHTGHGADPVIAAKEVHGYTLAEGKATPARLISLTAANGALVSNIDDLLKWNRALHEGRVLHSDSYHRMITPVGKAVPEQYAFGLWITTLRNHAMIGHSGLTSGFRAYLLYLPQTRISVAVLQNKDPVTGVGPTEIARKLAAFAIGEPYPAAAPIAADAVSLQQAQGVYGIDPPGSSYARVQSARVLRMIGGKLTIARTGGVRSDLIPIAVDTFQSSDSLDRVCLERDAAGTVTAVRFFPWSEGEGLLFARTSGSSAWPPLISLPRAALERVAGSYSADGMEMRVFLDGQQLKAELVGQPPAVTLLAESPNTFVPVEVDASVAFAPAEGIRRCSPCIKATRWPSSSASRSQCAQMNASGLPSLSNFLENVMNATQTIARSNLRVKPLVACLLAPLAIGNLACASAATIPVSNCNDAGAGSLREAIAAAHSGDTVDLTQLTCAKISLASGGLTAAVDDLTLRGPGANALTVAGSEIDLSYSHVLGHIGNGTLSVEGLRVTDSRPARYYSSACVGSTHGVSLNRSTVTKCMAGAVAAAHDFSSRDSTISDSSFGIVTGDGGFSMERSTISGNSGCALEFWHSEPFNPPTTSISNSTLTGNGAAGCFERPVTIRNSTIAFNAGPLTTGPLTIESSILANNGLMDLVATAPVSGHNNLVMQTTSALPTDTIRTDPQLLPLADNGGPTLTHALAPTSPAIDAGNNNAGLTTDQRGFARVAGAGPDIGAFESNAIAPPSGAIGPGFTGSWFDPAQSGHGLMLEVLSDNRLLAFWFSFNPQGNQQAWFGGVGTYSGNTATITDVALPTGGRWIPNFDPNAIVLNPWGTLTFTFTDCNHGKVAFNSIRGYGSGSMNLTRLTLPAGLTCP